MALPGNGEFEDAISAIGERLRAEPRAETRERHLDAIVTEARAVAERAPEPRRATLPAKVWGRPRARLAVKLATIAVAVPLTAAGMALAGWKLPEPAVSAFDAIGVTLPNQAGDEVEVEGKPERSAGETDRRGTRGEGRGEDSSPAQAGGHKPAGSPTEAPGSGRTGKRDEAPTGTPSGSPEGKPGGPPAGAPSGPPEGEPAGPPAGAPLDERGSGPPAGIPSGQPAGKLGGGPPAGRPELEPGDN